MRGAGSPVLVLAALPILIAGAGIGGLTVAIALARRGVPVVIAEKRTGFSEVGAGLQISPNAGSILSGLDIRLPLKRIEVRPEELLIRGWKDGAPRGHMPLNAGQDGNDIPFRVMKRADLHELLLDSARTLPGLRWLIGRSLTEISDTERGVSVTLVSESGQVDIVEAMGVIGADGLWSRTRELMGDLHAPAFTGWEAWRTLMPATVEPALARNPRVELHLGAARHAVQYPVAAGRELNLVVVRAAREARPGWSRDGDPATLASLADSAHPPLRRLIEAAPGWQVWSLFDRRPAAMAKGRIALLGDAAHPVLPFMAQGAAMAIEDAGILTRELVSHLAQDADATAVPAAFAAYAKARRARVQRIQQTSRDNGKAYHLGRPWSLARDMVLRRLGPDGMRERHAWIYDWRAPT